ncbi:unnamed protein product [Cuscuta campestris]|uniref:Bifunctional inhibitor/plant lipid transfer protein/seed storage helical domain-containing protein n=1 Tax=Cuscuta campestris TaxID=132261 RepID=A0A484MXZ4_9ASTE|nr:unnamed protein product [Cuscuta campestris]
MFLFNFMAFLEVVQNFSEPPPYSPKPPTVNPPQPYIPKPPTVNPPPPAVTPPYASPNPPPPVIITPPPTPPVVKPPLPPVVTPPYTLPNPPVQEPPCPPPAKQPTCPIDALKLGACVDLLGGLVHIGVGQGGAKDTCCPALNGLAGVDAGICLCTTIRAKLLNINIILPIALQVLVNDCGKIPPEGFQCPTS